MVESIMCDYCNKPAELVYGDRIYPHRQDLHLKCFWLCESCQAYVGCHKLTEEPLGRLANEELRKLKQETHSAFDPMWKSKAMTRNEAYAWLAGKLGIPIPNCHIGMFDSELCRKAIQICREFRGVEE